MKTIKYEMTQDQENLIRRALYTLAYKDETSIEDAKLCELLADEMYQHATGQDAVAVHQIYKLDENDQF
jgi:hypothetical protein